MTRPQILTLVLTSDECVTLRDWTYDHLWDDRLNAGETGFTGLMVRMTNMTTLGVGRPMIIPIIPLGSLVCIPTRSVRFWWLEGAENGQP